MTPNYDDLTYFLEVVSTKNLSRAAERLGITQPSISAAMKRLEISLDTDILLRTRTGVQLTKAGEELLLYSQKFLADWDHIKQRVKRTEATLAGDFSFGCHPSVALYALPLLLSHLENTLPLLHFHFTHDLSRKITERIISYDIDFGLIINPIQHPDLVIQSILFDEVCLWTRKNPSLKQQVHSPECTLIFDPHLKQSQTVYKQLSSYRFNEIHTNNLEVISALIESGQGIGILPTRVAHNDARSLMKEQALPYDSVRDELCFVYRGDKQSRHISRALGQEIQHALKP
ncbi:LysR family transcriptional regulator [Flocculibacter collagenilyticus]|uniref:LysR family transcriptional regulator n=1 Tax=Flocculibacter collagenilyticus TaxID=2744479 RepID=UPI0018F40CBF|nr:LysR family transcriptional regulator [Flocculibacter collagenilyticus]